MKHKDYIGQMWGNKLYIMRYKMKPDKITFNPYKNEYEKLLQNRKIGSLLYFLIFTIGMLLGVIACIITEIIK